MGNKKNLDIGEEGRIEDVLDTDQDGVLFTPFGINRPLPAEALPFLGSSAI